jgi:hypothetical protein
MKLVLKELGWETFTGHMAGLDFVDGVAIGEPHPRLFARLTSNMKVALVDENGKEKDASFAAGFISALEVAAEVIPPMKTLQELMDEGWTQEQPKVESKKAKVAIDKVTKEELEKIADKDGIEGLREFVKEKNLEVKARSVPELIEKIVEASE